MLASGLGYATFALLVVVGPGLALHRVLRLPIDAALVLPLGTAVGAGSYWLSLATGLPWLFPVVIAAFCAVLSLPHGPWVRAEGPSLRGALPVCGALVLLLAVTQYPWNRYGPAGEFVLDPLVPFDTAFHVGLARELTLGYPPQVPGVAGFPLGYHLGADLLRAAALRWAGVDPYDAITRLDSTLGAIALVLLLRAVVKRMGGNTLAVAMVPWTLLATDLSWIFGGNPQSHWWTDLLRGNLLLSLCMANPIVPALALTLGALLALSRHTAGEGRGWLALAAIQAAAVPFFKVFLGAHLLLGLGVAWLFAGAQTRRALVLMAAPALLATGALVFGQGGSTVAVALAPLDLVRTTRDTLGLAPISGASLAAWAALWLTASLGLRVLGLPAATSAVRQSDPIGAALAAMALSAWPLGLLFRVSAPQVLDGQKVVNDAAYLVEQGGPLLWIFTAMALARLAVRGPMARAAAAIAALTALPSTVQYAVQKNLWPNDAIPASRVRAARAIEKVSQPGDVVLQRPGARFPPAPVLLASRRVPYERFTPWLTQFASREDLERRHEAVYRFFRTEDRDEAIGIARELGARFVCLYDGERVRFDSGGLMELIYEEPAARAYRLRLP